MKDAKPTPEKAQQKPTPDKAPDPQNHSRTPETEPPKEKRTDDL